MVGHGTRAGSSGEAVVNEAGRFVGDERLNRRGGTPTGHPGCGGFGVIRWHGESSIAPARLTTRSLRTIEE